MVKLMSLGSFVKNITSHIDMPADAGLHAFWHSWTNSRRTL